MKANLPVRRAHDRRAARTPAPLAAAALPFAGTAACVLDTVVVGVEDAPSDRTVNVQANSREVAGVKTLPRVARAERG